MRRVDRTSALLMLPLLAWLAVALALNAATVWLNPPFGA
jgi:tryptophan-rich sensory protein